jgi:hypothetical protein
VPDPAGIGDDGDPFPLWQMVDGDIEIAPPGARKPGADLIVQPDFAVPSERGFHRRPQDIVALFVGDPSCRDDTDDVIGQLLDDFDHEAPCSNINFVD